MAKNLISILEEASQVRDQIKIFFLETERVIEYFYLTFCIFFIFIVSLYVGHSNALILITGSSRGTIQNG